VNADRGRARTPGDVLALAMAVEAIGADSDAALSGVHERLGLGYDLSARR
jgi:hypothetical protein